MKSKDVSHTETSILNINMW